MIDEVRNLFPNMDFESGIHYGAISQNSLDLDALYDWYENDAYYDEAKDEISNGIESALSDYLDPVEIEDVIDVAIDKFNEAYQCDEPAFYYEDDEYSAEYSHDMCCWIIKKSPYYTYCKGCSPCVPNAGDLDSPVTPDDYEKDNNASMHEIRASIYGGIKKTYCLPKEFFIDSKAPYEYFEVPKEG